MRRVLITGGAGFIGFRLAQELAPLTDELVLVDRIVAAQADEELRAFLAATRHARLVAADLLSPELGDILGRNYDVVFHLAATVGVESVESDPVGVVRNNVVGTLNLLDWFARSGSRKLVFSSTSEVYAGAERSGILPIPTPEDVPAVVADVFHPRSSYAISKIAGEHLVAQVAARAGTEFCVLRYHNVYGPRMGWKHVVPQLMQRMQRGEDPFVVRSAGHARAFCYVDDAVRATVAVAQCAAAAGKVVHIGNGREAITILDLAQQIARTMGCAPRFAPAPDQIGSVARRVPDTTRLEQLTGWQPTVDLRSGLARTYEWYRSRL
jgi:UDP-glucuronate decarboxylase